MSVKAESEYLRLNIPSSLREDKIIQSEEVKAEVGWKSAEGAQDEEQEVCAQELPEEPP